jgi:hypothetical protein
VPIKTQHRKIMNTVFGRVLGKRAVVSWVGWKLNVCQNCVKWQTSPKLNTNTRGDIFRPQHAAFVKLPFCTCSWQMTNGGWLWMKCRKNSYVPV